MKGEAKLLLRLCSSHRKLAKKELDDEAAITAAQVQLKKDAQTSKAAFKKDLKVLTTSYATQEEVGVANKAKISNLNFDQTSWMKTRTDLQIEVKNQTKDLKALTKRVDTQLQK
jgi:hypothetical protein